MKALKWVGIVAAGLVVLVVGGLFVAAMVVDLDKLVNEQVAAHRPELERRLGRKVEVGRVTTGFFPSLSGRVEKIRIERDPARPQDDRPLLEVDAVGFRISLWDVLKALGGRVAVSSVYAEGVRISLVRYADGTLSYQDILDRQPSDGPPPPPKAEEGSPMEDLRRISFGEIRVADAAFRLVDHATATGRAAESQVKKVNLRMADVRLDDTIRVNLDAAIFSEETNFELAAAVGPLPADLKGLPPIGGTRLRVKQVDLSRLAPYLGRAVPLRIDSAVIDASLDVEQAGPKAPMALSGSLGAAQVRMKGGRPFDVKVEAKLAADAASASADVAKLELRLGEIELTASGVAKDLTTAPSFKDFKVRSKNLDPALLFSYVPQAREGLPPGSKIEGPIRLEAQASGDAQRQEVGAQVDLTALEILIPDRLTKPRGTALALRLEAAVSPSDVQLARLTFQLDELEITGKGTVGGLPANPTFDLTAAARPFAFERLARLVPAVRDGMKSSGAAGQGTVEARLEGTPSNLDAAVKIALLGVKLDVPGTRLGGDLTFQATAKGNPERDLAARLALDADKAVIQLRELMDKGVATPLHLEVEVNRAASVVTVEKFALRLAELGLDVKGTLDLDKGTSDVAIDLKPIDLEKLARTVTAIPPRLAKKSHLAMKMSIRGDPNRMETMELGIDGLDAQIGRSDLKGSMAVKNLLRPQAAVTLASKRLDVDELFPPQAAGAEKPKKGQPPAKRGEPKDDESLKAYRFAGDLEAKEIILRGDRISDFKGLVKLEDGVFTLERCTFGIWGGSVVAQDTRAEIWRGRMPFQVDLALQGIEMNQALSSQTRYKNTLYGKSDVGVKLRGVGTETADLEKSLTGAIDLSMKEGRWAKASLLESVTGKMGALSKIPGAPMKAVKGENRIKDLVTQLEARDGKLWVKQPVSTQVDGARLTLGGAIGIAGGLFLEGTYHLPGSTVASMSGGKCRSDQELPVPMKIGGTADSPSVQPDVGGAAGGVMSSCAGGAAGAVAGKLLGDKVGGKLGGKAVPTSLKGGQDLAKAEAENKARAERDRAEAEARAKADAQKRAAEEAAKKKAKESLKKLNPFGR